MSPFANQNKVCFKCGFGIRKEVYKIENGHPVHKHCATEEKK